MLISQVTRKIDVGIVQGSFCHFMTQNAAHGELRLEPERDAVLAATIVNSARTGARNVAHLSTKTSPDLFVILAVH